MKKLFRHVAGYWLLLLVSNLFMTSGFSADKQPKAVPMDAPITVIATYIFNEGHLDTVAETIRKLVAETRKEPGNIRYEAYHYMAHPRKVVFFERFASEAAHDSHLHSKHFIEAHKILDPLLLYKPRIDKLQTYLAAPTHLNEALGLYQVATIGALAQGVFDGDIPYSVVMKHGTMGLGTFKHLNGEMVAVDGNYYQIDANGKLTKVSPKQIAPFAEVVEFIPRLTLHLPNDIKDFNALGEFVLKAIKNKNKPVAIRVDGTFDELTLRSFRQQLPPYSNLAIASKDQALFHLKKVQGSLIGFWFPSYWAGIAVSGFHLHFVNTERTIGGHVLALKGATGILALQSLSHIRLQLPQSEGFAKAHLSAEHLLTTIHQAEGGHDTWMMPGSVSANP